MSHSCASKDQYFFLRPAFVRYFLSWSFAILSIAGIFGSILCITVIIKHRVFVHGTRYWFIYLSMSDILMLVIPAMDFYMYYMLGDHYVNILTKMGIFGCEFRFCAINFLGWVANVLQAGLSIERTISVLDPIRSRIIFTTGRTKLIIGFLISVSFISSTAINMLTFIRVNGSCIRKTDPNASVVVTDVVYSIDLIIFRAIPFLVMLFSSIVIVILLKIHSRKRDRLGQSVESSNRKSVLKNREFKMSVILISMNVATLITNPLFLIFELIDGAGSEGHAYGKLTNNPCISDFFNIFFNYLIYFNNQTNWIFYVLIGAKFQHYFVVILSGFCPFFIKERDESSSYPYESTMYYDTKIKRDSSSMHQNRINRHHNSPRQFSCLWWKHQHYKSNNKNQSHQKSSTNHNKETEIIALIHTTL